MKLSIFATGTNPMQRGDTFSQAYKSYKELADEIIIVDGGNAKTNLHTGEVKDYGIKKLGHKTIILHSGSCDWPKEFSWEFIGQQFQRGFEACTGDWAIRMDLDMIFHEDDYNYIRFTLEQNPYCLAVMFPKYQFIQPDRYIYKSKVILAINRRYADRVRFDGGGDLCQPTLDGKPISKEDSLLIDKPVWNYECLLKTKEQLMEDKGRFARAWQKRFGVYKLGGPDDQSAYDNWLHMVLGRNTKPSKRIPLEAHPKVMHDTLRSLKPENWGYSGFGNYERCSYAQDIARN